MTRKSFLQNLLTENLSYKFVSLCVAVILWMTVLGRRDFVVTKNIDVELLTSLGQQVNSQSVEQVRVKVSGPRPAIKKFLEGGENGLLTVDISKLGEGQFDVEIPLGKIDLPFGVKLVSVRPTTIKTKVVKVNP